MAGLFGRRIHQVAHGCISSLGLLVSLASRSVAGAQSLYERPVLAIDLDMHTAITHAASDEAGRFFVTGSYDKTVRIWSASEGKLLRTIRVPSGSGFIGKLYTVAMSPDGEEIAAGGWTESDDYNVIYLFDRASGRLVTRIGKLSEVATWLAYSRGGRYLAAGLGGGGLRVFDRERDWSEVHRDLAYEDQIYGLAFASDGRLAVSSLDGKVRLYDSSFKLIVTQPLLSGKQPLHIAFNPEGTVLAVGYDDTAAVDILDGNTLARMAGRHPMVRGFGSLGAVAWSSDGQTLFASGGFRQTLDRLVFSWDQAGRVGAASAKCAENDQLTQDLVAAKTDSLLVVKANPCLALLNESGDVLWTHRPPMADFRNQSQTFSVSADGALVDFGFEHSEELHYASMFEV